MYFWKKYSLIPISLVSVHILGFYKIISIQLKDKKYVCRQIIIFKYKIKQTKLVYKKIEGPYYFKICDFKYFKQSKNNWLNNSCSYVILITLSKALYFLSSNFSVKAIVLRNISTLLFLLFLYCF